MAYPNNYFNSFYQPQYPVQMQQNVQQNNGITWVQGENSAKSYPIAAGQSILLMDSENPVMYIKSTDQSGVPLPLRIFDYTERKNEHITQNNAVMTQNTDYVSRSEFDAFKSEITQAIKQRQNNTNQQRKPKEE